MFVIVDSSLGIEAIVGNRVWNRIRINIQRADYGCRKIITTSGLVAHVFYDVLRRKITIYNK